MCRLQRLELESDDSPLQEQLLLYGRVDWKASLSTLKHLKSLVRAPFDPDSQDNVEACVQCLSKDNESQLILCDTCPATYHTSCLRPPLKSVPEGAWTCTLCSLAAALPGAAGAAALPGAAGAAAGAKS